MCTVVIRVPENVAAPVRVLAVRDEDPARPWNPLGEWWPNEPGVIGVQDRLAGGAWLAASNREDGGRLAVILNRLGTPDLPAEQILSRGGIVLDSVAGRTLPAHPHTMGFNLVSIADGNAELSSWDGRELRTTKLAPGTHMIAHEDLDDATTPRIVAWRDEFAVASTEGSTGSTSDDANDSASDDPVSVGVAVKAGFTTDVSVDVSTEWWQPWLAILERSAELPPEDDRAIIRDNRAHGYPTLSLLACVASVSNTGTDVRYAQLAEAGRWSELDFTSSANAR